MSQPIEVESIRHEIARDVLLDVPEPHILLRVGWQAIGRSGLPRTPRRPLHEVLVRHDRGDAEGPRPRGPKVPPGGEVRPWEAGSDSS
ncbi:hypothetical protein G5V59_01105 [Nocardioides sp. W3-2-3]|uniref:hypothetical protein n=1 Tax=Nocardioides convexus TaxID=2712224 RepID=UPI0024183E97|nr:hypothetical protein [Nocardioides convexus]NGZ99495.1 hypothetical protein [Nocardioides convexus]